MIRIERAREIVSTAVIAAVLYAVPAGAQMDQGAVQTAPEPPSLADLPDQLVRVVEHPDEEVLEVIIGPAELEAGGHHLRLPVQLMEVPFAGWLHGFEWEIRNAAGEKLPDDLLHHVNFIDPDRRELFAPIPRRVAAAGRETDKLEVPHLIGYPIEANTRLLVSAMLAAPDERNYQDVYLHVRFFYSKAGENFIAPRDIYLFYVDVMGPVGLKDFPVPPGRTVKSWEGSPAIDGRILAIGGHLHNYADHIRLEDVTEGETIWEAEPEVDEEGHVTGVPTSHLWWKGGVKIYKDHTYRVVVEYRNPMDHPTPDGGMGALGGVFIPSGDQEWPEFDRRHPQYVADLRNTLEAPEKLGGHGHGGGHEGAAGPPLP